MPAPCMQWPLHNGGLLPQRPEAACSIGLAPCSGLSLCCWDPCLAQPGRAVSRSSFPWALVPLSLCRTAKGLARRTWAQRNGEAAGESWQQLEQHLMPSHIQATVFVTHRPLLHRGCWHSFPGCLCSLCQASQ